MEEVEHGADTLSGTMDGKRPASDRPLPDRGFAGRGPEAREFFDDPLTGG
jgi:hypothetical protein